MFFRRDETYVQQFATKRQYSSWCSKDCWRFQKSITFFSWSLLSFALTQRHTQRIEFFLVLESSSLYSRRRFDEWVERVDESRDEIARKSRQVNHQLQLINTSMFYRDTNVLLSRTSSTDDVFSSFARDFDLDTSKTIRVLVTSLKERSIRDESVEDKRRENIENSVEDNEISESDESERSHRSHKSERSNKNHKDSKSVRNRNQDNWVDWSIEQEIAMTRRASNTRRIIWSNVARWSSFTIDTRNKCHLQSLIRSFERLCFERLCFESDQRWLKKKKKKT
jgi:hypothetical protein